MRILRFVIGRPFGGDETYLSLSAQLGDRGGPTDPASGLPAPARELNELGGWAPGAGPRPEPLATRRSSDAEIPSNRT
jgi:hypothetical protein